MMTGAEIKEANQELFDRNSDHIRIKYLLRQGGANPDHKAFAGKYAGWSVLAYAIYKGHNHTAYQLLESGANGHQFFVNSSLAQWSLVNYSFYQRNPALASYLLEHKAHVNDNFNAGSWRRWTPVTYSVYRCYNDMENIIFDSLKNVSEQERKNAVDFNFPDGQWEGWSPLGYAVHNGRDKTAFRLLQNGVNPNQRFPASSFRWNNWSLLAYTVYKGKTKLACLLLEKKANPEETFPDGQYENWHVLAFAVYKNYSDVVEQLLLQGVNQARVRIPQKKWRESTLIEYAVYHGYAKIVSLLKNPPALVLPLALQPQQLQGEVEGEVKENKEGVKVAAKKAKQEARRLKRIEAERKAKEELENKAKEKDKPPVYVPVDDAASMHLPGNTVTDEPGLSVASDVLQAASGSDISKLNRLKEQKTVDFLVLDENKNSGLHLATSNGADEEVLRFFIDAGCDLNGLNANGESPLFLAVTNGHVELADYLVGLGANLTKSCGQDGYTPLVQALKTKQSVDMLKVLVHLDIDFNLALQGHSEPPLNLAARFGHENAIDFFVTVKRANVNGQEAKDAVSPLADAVMHGQEKAVIKLIMLGADYDAQSPAWLEILVKMEKNVADAGLKSKIRGHLANSVAMKKRKKELSDQFAIYIFLLLFADINDARNRRANIDKYPNLVAFLKLAMSEFPALDQMPRKINVNLSAEKSMDELYEEKQLVNFLGRVVPQEYKQSKDKWAAILDKKEQDKSDFKYTLHSTLRAYLALSDTAIWKQRVIDQSLSGLPTQTISGTPQDNIKNWLDEAISNDRFINAYLKSREKDIKHERSIADFQSDLIATLQDEIKASLEEHTPIVDVEHKGIYTKKIKASIDYCLYKHKLSSPEEQTAYKCAEELVNILRIKCNKKKWGMKDKKMKLAAYLIKNLLLSQPSLRPVVRLLSDEKQWTSLRDYLVEKLEKDDMTAFSYKSAGYDKYSRLVTEHIKQWVLDQKPTYPISHHSSSSIYSFHSSESRDSDIAHYEFTQKQKIFIDNFVHHFDDLYCKFRALDLKLVKRLEEKADAAKKLADSNHFPNITLGPVDIPTDFVLKMVTQFMVYLQDNEIENASRRMSDLFSGYTPLKRGEIFDIAAMSLAARFEFQIENLSSLGIQKLAEIAAYRAVQFTTASDKNLTAYNPPLFSKLVSTFADLIYGNDYHPSLSRVLKMPVQVIIGGVLKGKCKEDEKPLGTEVTVNRQYHSVGIFDGTGVIVKSKDGHSKYYTHKNLAPDMETQEPYFGFCYAPREQVFDGQKLRPGWVEVGAPKSIISPRNKKAFVSVR